MERITIIGSLLLILCFSACAGSYKHRLNYDTSEPLRVAVLPFVFVDKNGEVMELDGNLAIDNVALVSQKLDEGPPTLVRTMVFSALEKTGKEVIAPSVVDGALHHSGFSQELVFDYKKIYSVKPTDLGDLLGADALLYGKITKWDRSYYGLQTVNTVGLDIKLVSTRTGAELFSATAEDSDSRGLSKGPTGWSSLALEPIKGLDSDIIVELARGVIERMLKPMSADTNRQKAVGPAPSILASSHDGQNARVDTGQYLTVLMLGTPNRTAYFSLGDKVENLPMLEKEDGHYIGEYYPLPSDRFAKEYITVTLVDQFGRKTTQKVGMSSISVNQ